MSAEKILAVDDSASMRQMVAFTLRDAGFDVAEAADGQEALEMAQREPYRLVLCDVNMPRMDGISLVRELRQIPSYKFTPLLMLTTESGPEKKQEGKAAGATGWLVKPFNPEQLVATVQRVLG
ncbi:response regulator [Solimonas marina]|uniref:Response regulator n=1 Tax=Solimonas marina TaxID=2714601 RepID=A0A969W6T1_9GAMM|nr:response regulator [Solimonas marina]NKF21716.1 response regulator [Solimonas marina]